MLYALVSKDVLGFDSGTHKYTITDNLNQFWVDSFEQLNEIKNVLDMTPGTVREYCFASFSYPFEFNQSKESDDFLKESIRASGHGEQSLTFLVTVICKIVI